MAIIRMRDHLYDEIVNYAKEHNLPPSLLLSMDMEGCLPQEI